VDITGKLVTPGFIDLHGHFYDGSGHWHDGSPIYIDADKVCLSGGVTTGVDAGSAGWTNYKTMRGYIVPTKVTRLVALLHIGATGLLRNEALGGELQDIRHADPDRVADAIKEDPGYLVSVKVRMLLSAVSYWEAETALKRATEAADMAGVKLMARHRHAHPAACDPGGARYRGYRHPHLQWVPREYSGRQPHTQTGSAGGC